MCIPKHFLPFFKLYSQDHILKPYNCVNPSRLKISNNLKFTQIATRNKKLIWTQYFYTQFKKILIVLHDDAFKLFLACNSSSMIFFLMERVKKIDKMKNLAMYFSHFFLLKTLRPKAVEKYYIRGVKIVIIIRTLYMYVYDAIIHLTAI